MLDAGFPRGALNYWKSNFMSELSDQAIDTLISQFAACPSPMSGLLLEHIHGAATRVGVSETAFPHRREGYNFLVVSEWLDPADNAQNIAWARESYDAMRPGSQRGLCTIWETTMAKTVAAAYGPNYQRLRTLKRSDPASVPNRSEITGNVALRVY
jgi:hypothetical protein